MNNKIQSDKGISLVELLIVLLLISLILGLAFRFFMVSDKTYTTGVNKASLQQDSRMCGKIITDELKNAVIVSESIPEEKTYYKIFLEKNTNDFYSLIIEYYEKNTMSEKKKYGNYITSLKFNTKGNSNIINFTISANAEKENFIIESSVFLNNINSINIDEGITEIYYTLYK